MSDAQEIIDAAQLAVIPKELEAGKVYAVADGGRGVQVIDTMAYADVPARQKRHVRLTDVNSFTHYLIDNANPILVEVFFDAAELKATAILDPKGWREDRVSLELTKSPEWTDWAKASGVLLPQVTFASFIEDQISTIVAPDGATLLEIAQSMEAATKVDWKSAEWLANGQRNFKFDQQIEAKAGRSGQLEIPAQFTLALRPFLGCDPYEVKANLRYRISEGDLFMGFKLVEPERRLEAAVADVVKVISDELGVTVLMGRP